MEEAVRGARDQASDPPTEEDGLPPDVAAAVADGRADAGFGLRAEATRLKLAFVPLAVERYFFACAKSALRGVAVKALVELLRGKPFADAVAHLPGYDASRSGDLEALDAALTWLERAR